MGAKRATSYLGRMEPSASRPGSVGGDGGAERGDDDGAGDPVVGGDGQGQVGVIIDPAKDRRPQPGERPVGEVRLPAFVRQVGCEPRVGRPRALGRVGDHQPGLGQVTADRGR